MHCKYEKDQTKVHKCVVRATAKRDIEIDDLIMKLKKCVQHFKLKL